ncbi:hypothetical protein BKA23_0122 [Rudaeicoccus suwonensis]|uniref:Uncharacterized protein n=2 Tax=Rudaeicoccus suwonensis TaxID=657409 RepID=A0A561E725_9MICO|nr:hypothetical protein BKA23_0122 [Rudaeicoccus suwonensis]
MWVDSNGIFHTTSMPDFSPLVGDSAVTFVCKSRRRTRKVIQQLVEEEEERFYDEASTIADIALHGTALAFPPGPVLGAVKSVDDFRTGLAQISLTWQLDAVVAIDELLGRTAWPSLRARARL